MVAMLLLVVSRGYSKAPVERKKEKLKITIKHNKMKCSLRKQCLNMCKNSHNPSQLPQQKR